MPKSKNTYNKKTIWITNETKDLTLARRVFLHEDIIDFDKTKIEEDKILNLEINDDCKGFGTSKSDIHKVLHNTASKLTPPLGEQLASLPKAIRNTNKITLTYNDDIDNKKSVIMDIKSSLNKGAFFLYSDSDLSDISTVGNNIIIEDGDPDVVSAIPDSYTRIYLNAYSTSPAIEAIPNHIITIKLCSLNLTSEALKALIKYVCINRNTKITFDNEPISLLGTSITTIAAVLSGEAANLSDSETKLLSSSRIVHKNFELLANIAANTAQSTEYIASNKEVIPYLFISLLNADSLDQVAAQYFVGLLSDNQRGSLVQFYTFLQQHLNAQKVTKTGESENSYDHDMNSESQSPETQAHLSGNLNQTQIAQVLLQNQLLTQYLAQIDPFFPFFQYLPQLVNQLLMTNQQQSHPPILQNNGYPQQAYNPFNPAMGQNQFGIPFYNNQPQAQPQPQAQIQPQIQPQVQAGVLPSPVSQSPFSLSNSSTPNFLVPPPTPLPSSSSSTQAYLRSLLRGPSTPPSPQQHIHDHHAPVLNTAPTSTTTTTTTTTNLNNSLNNSNPSFPSSPSGFFRFTPPVTTPYPPQPNTPRKGPPKP